MSNAIYHWDTENLCKQLTESELSKLVEERDLHNPNQTLIIEHKYLPKMLNINLNNIVFKFCIFNSAENSDLNNITFDNCYFCKQVAGSNNNNFKNLVIQNCLFNHGFCFCNCIFDNLTFKNTAKIIHGFYNCTIKNTDFRGQEDFFVICMGIHGSLDEKISNNHPFDYIPYGLTYDNNAYLRGPHELDIDPFIKWHDLKFENCIIGTKDIKNLAEYVKYINPFTYGGATFNLGQILLNGANQKVKEHIIASTLLYNPRLICNKSGCLYEGNGLHEKNIRQARTQSDLEDCEEYLELLPKDNPINIVDEDGNIIDPKSIARLDKHEIKFINRFSRPRINVFSSRYSEFQAKELNNNSAFNKPFNLIGKSLENN